LIISTIDDDFPFQKLVTNVFKAFIAGCLAGTLMLFGIAIFKFAHSSDPSVFFYTSFSNIVHVSYLSMYLNLAIAILAFYLIRKEYRLPDKFRILFYVLVIYFSFVTFLLSSKAGIFSLLFLYFIIILYLLFINKQIWKGIVLLGVILITFFSLFTFLPNTTQRFKRAESVISDKNKVHDVQESNNERLVVWKAGLQIIKQHPIFGVGTGDVKDALLAEYQKENNLVVFNMKLNAHNQYIQTYIALGFLGTLLLLYMLILPAWNAFRRIYFIYFLFLAVFAINILVESMLEVQAGVVYYAFFNALFFFGWKYQKE
jgi:O-antigen ligase